MLDLHEVIELENRWKEYKAKKQKKINIIVFSLLSFCFVILIIFIVLYFYNKGASELENNIIRNNSELKAKLNNAKIKQEKEKNLKTKQTPKTNQIVNIDNIQQEQENMDSDNVELPSLFIHKINTKKEIYNKNTPKKVVKKPKVIKTTPKEINVSNVITISKKDSKVDKTNTLEYLLIKYNETKSIYFALDISDEYYKKGDYKNAKKWALIANDIDNENEKSWIMFARSSYKLGYKEQALNALLNYQNTKPSRQVSKLIEEIREGRL